MKKIIVVLFLFSFLKNFSQEIDITKSEIFKDSKKHSYLFYSIEDDNGGLVTIRAFYGGMLRQLKGYYIQYFDSKLKLINELEYKPTESYIRNAFIKDRQLHLIEFEKDNKSKTIVFNVKTASLPNLEFNTKEVLSLSEEDQVNYFGITIFPFKTSNFSQYDENHSGEIVFSKNKNFFVINFDIKNKKKETHKIFVFNNKFEKQYSQIIQKNIADRYFDYKDIDIDDNDGTVYFLGKSFENKSRKSKKKGVSNYYHELYKVKANGTSKATFKSDDKFISSIKIIQSKDHLACVGFYGNNDIGKINGACFFKLNPETLKIEDKKYNGFSQQFLTDKYGNKNNKKRRKEKKGIKNVEFRRVSVSENGDITINAEEFYTTISTSIDANGNVTTRTIYNFDDIISLKMNQNGSLKWARNINKRQTGLSNSSFTPISVNNNSFFFINCSDKIVKLSDNRIAFKQTKAKKSNLYTIIIDESGNIDSKKLIDDKDSKVYYKVNNGNINDKNKTVILTGSKKKNKQILKLKIN